MFRRPKSSMIDSSIKRLQEVGVNFLAVDFDMTILSVHTGGRWDKSAEELIQHIRPEFDQLLNACVANDIKIAVVTYTAQVTLVRAVLENILGPEQASRIPVRGADRSWSYQGVGSQERKLGHIASAVEELEQSGEVEITKNTTLLIDDDRKNIRCALEDGVRAIWFNPDKPHHLLRDLTKLV
jgi:2-hydroxy-3-keto-5-methylthiopentenyl-1-phosphate phosphatase